MRVCVSVDGVFHAWHLAAQLHRHGALDALLTSFPAIRISERVSVDLPRSKIRSNHLHAVATGLKRAHIDTPALQALLHTLHDRFAARHLRNDLDFFVGWSGSSLRAIRRAKQLGVTSVLVRGSSHILEQIDILRDEYARHGLTFEVPPRLVETQLAEYEEADYVQTNSSFARDTLVAHGVAARRILLNNTGVDVETFHPLPRGDDIFRVIYVGNLGLRKGSPYLLQAFAELDLPAAELWHLGAVSKEMRPLLARYGDAAIRVLGYQPVRELNRYYSQCSVFVFPSLEEGLATVQTQAMACGLPLVCTPNTGGADLLSGEGIEGFVVPIRDVAALKEKILYLYENPQVREQMGRAARRRVVEHYTWDAYGDRMLAIYRELARSSASA